MNSQLNRTDGHLIAGVKLNDHQFLGRLKAALLFQIAPDPRDAEDRKKVDAARSFKIFEKSATRYNACLQGPKLRTYRHTPNI